jgi:hypothetical protein
VVTRDAVSETVVERGGRLYDVSGLEVSLNELRAHLRSELFGGPDGGGDGDGGEPAPVAPAPRSTTATLDAMAATVAMVCTAAVFAKVLA